MLASWPGCSSSGDEKGMLLLHPIRWNYKSPWHSCNFWIIDAIYKCIIFRTSNQLPGMANGTSSAEFDINILSYNLFSLGPLFYCWIFNFCHRLFLIIGNIQNHIYFTAKTGIVEWGGTDKCATPTCFYYSTLPILHIASRWPKKWPQKLRRYAPTKGNH